MNDTLAYADRNGFIGFTDSKLPSGMLPIAKGNADALRETISSISRHAYDGETLLVPGIPEADSGEDALAALQRFNALVKKRLAVWVAA